LGCFAGGVEDAGCGADVHQQGSADVGLPGHAGHVGGLELPDEQTGGDERLSQRVGCDGLAEPGRDQQRAELVAVRRDGMGFVVHPRTADVRVRGMLKELFFDRVFVEPGDGSRRVTVARARPLTSSSLAKLSMSARRTANSGRERVRHQVVNWRKSSAYASRVRPQYPARYPARASRSGSVKAGWIVASAVDGAAVVTGHLPAGLEPGRLGQFRSQRLNLAFNLCCLPGNSLPVLSGVSL
jgi:hypothetical protein